MDVRKAMRCQLSYRSLDFFKLFENNAKSWKYILEANSTF